MSLYFEGPTRRHFYEATPCPA